MNWILYPVISAIMWGVGFALLTPISEKLNAYTINTLYGFFTFVVNLVIIAITDTFDNFLEINNWKLVIYLAFYVILLVAASIVFLVGYNVENVNPGVYIIISNSYPIITLLLAFFFFGKTNLNPYYTIFGTIFTLVGCGLLAFAKN